MSMSLRDGDLPSKQSPFQEEVASQSALATTCKATGRPVFFRVVTVPQGDHIRERGT
jgi:hypothetical protein